jgi:hypothetical protein
MAGKDRAVIQKRESQLILKDYRSRDLALYYLTEKTLRKGFH